MTQNKRIFVIAGPNGAGKTTTAVSLNPTILNFYEFINADDIARALAPLHPESMALTASKLMLKRLRELLEANKSFAFETTAAGTNFIKYLKAAQSKQYQINLIFLWLASPELAVERVAKRVTQGGHHIPEETIRRRYRLGQKNLIKYYLPLADHALILDNSYIESRKVIAEGSCNRLEIKIPHIWETIERSLNA